jgi:hypothetical protein
MGTEGAAKISTRYSTASFIGYFLFLEQRVRSVALKFRQLWNKTAELWAALSNVSVRKVQWLSVSVRKVRWLSVSVRKVQWLSVSVLKVQWL